MSNFTRKDFIKLSSWGFIGAMLPIQKINALSSVFSNQTTSATPEDDYASAVIIARDAKNYFYNKDFVNAERLYLSCIALAPASIRFYDGLDNVFGAQNLSLQSAQLYKNGLLRNPGNVAFYDRAARALMRLHIGNKREALIYKNDFPSISLLEDAVLLYKSAIQIDSSKRYLQVGLDKVQAKIVIEPLIPGYKENRVFKNLKNQNRNTFKSAINNKTDKEIEVLIARLDTKPRRELYKTKEIEERIINMKLQKKKYYDILQNRINQNDPEKLENIERLFALDLSDPNSLRKLKIVYYSHNRYFDFINVRRQYAETVRTVSGYLGLMDTMEVAFKKNQNPMVSLQQAVDVSTDLLTNWSLTFQQEIEVVTKTSKIYCHQSDYLGARNLLMATMTKVKTDSYRINNTLILHFAKSYYEAGDYENAKNAILIGVKELNTEDTNTVIEHNGDLLLVKNLADNKTLNEFKNNLTLYYLLYKIYYSQNDIQAATSVLDRLLLNNPVDGFVTSKV